MATPEKIESRDGTALPIEDVKDGNLVDYELTPEEDNALLRKIDRCLLPIMAISYLFQFMDKTALGGTAILGITKDLHLTGLEYSWASSIYYFGYMIASYPVGVLMVRWKVGKTIATSVFTWGAILMLTAVCTNAGGLLATRVFLGITEAAIAPGLTVVVAMWYKRSEQPIRHAAWYMGNTIAGIAGSLLQYAIGHIHTIAPWKAVFLILGGVTVFWGACIFFLLPDDLLSSWFLNKEERHKAVIRVKENMTGIKSNEFKWSQVKEALLDLKTWFLFFIQLNSSVPNGGVTSFTPIIINGFGFSPLNSLLLGCLPYVFQFIFVWLAVTGSTYFRNTRTLWMLLNFSISIIGSALVRFLPVHKTWGRLIGVSLIAGYSGSFPLIMSLLSSNFGGFTKKTTVNAICFLAYCTGNIIGPQLFFAKQAPTYESAFLGMLICLCIGFVLTLTFRLYLQWVNSVRDRETGSADFNDYIEADTGELVNLTDKTDKEIPQFRYMY